MMKPNTEIMWENDVLRVEAITVFDGVLVRPDTDNCGEHEPHYSTTYCIASKFDNTILATTKNEEKANRLVELLSTEVK